MTQRQRKSNNRQTPEAGSSVQKIIRLSSLPDLKNVFDRLKNYSNILLWCIFSYTLANTFFFFMIFTATPTFSQPHVQMKTLIRPYKLGCTDFDDMRKKKVT